MTEHVVLLAIPVFVLGAGCRGDEVAKDACVTNNGGCGNPTYYACTNNDGAAPTCADINECVTNNGGCGNPTYYACTNNDGAAPTCRDINECATNNGGCGDPAAWQCVNNSGADPTCNPVVCVWGTGLWDTCMWAP